MTSSTSPRASFGGRLLWSIQLVVFLAAGLFVTPIARPVQNATGPIASTPHHAERVVASRERSAERIGRTRADQPDSGHEPVWLSGSALPVVGPADFVAVSPWSVPTTTPRRIRFALHAPRGPPLSG